MESRKILHHGSVQIRENRGYAAVESRIRQAAAQPANSGTSATNVFRPVNNDFVSNHRSSLKDLRHGGNYFPKVSGSMGSTSGTSDRAFSNFFLLARDALRFR